jgi:transcriptional regulator with GAF, ATPase, and Fis domain
MQPADDRFSILYDIALTVGKSLDLKRILDDVLDRIIRFMGVDAGVIYVVDDATMEMIPVSFRNLLEEVVRDLSDRKVKVGECMCGTIAQCNQEVIITERASEDPRFTRGVLKKEGMEFYAGLPILARGKVVGVLCVINHTPYRLDRGLLDILRAATQPIGLAIENSRIFETVRKEADARIRYFNFEGIIANSPKMAGILSLVRKITDVPTSILIYGESGTGKELIARAIHFNSIRKERPFIAVNCAALPESLLESELFGYVKGAFTGAGADKKGLFEAADNGTMFLDEAEAMSGNLQVKLLRVLQDGAFLKVGGTQPCQVNVRIIAASNRNLEEAIREKAFREDLYYRLNVIRIDLPPLRDRREDVPLLTRYFMAKYSKKIGKNVRRIADGAMEALVWYPWPGNIRQLENMVERAVVVTETDEITREDLAVELLGIADDVHKDLSLRRVEKEHILHVLKLTGGNKKQAARELGVNTATLWRKLKSFEPLP